VGNRAIDLLVETSGDSPAVRRLYIIELKDDSPRVEHEDQIGKYVRWAIDQYLSSENYEELVPVLVTTKPARATKSRPAWKPGQLGPFLRGPMDYSAKVAPLLHLLVDDSDPKKIHLTSTY
jgi:hypothetical protein